MNFKRKLLIFLISFIFIIPLNTFAYSKYLIPGGENIGIKVLSKGIFVVGFYSVDGKNIAKDAGFKLGDQIVSVNDNKINNILDLVKNINSKDEIINVKYGIMRNNKLAYINMQLKKDSFGSYKTGIYVKDTITGIGTITFIDPVNNSFGALGHEIEENNTKQNFPLGEGYIYKSKITSIDKASFGKPGEKNAKIDMENIYGVISENLETGIYGKLEKEISKEKPIEIMDIDEVKIGKAEIITVLDDNKKEKYAIEILSIDKDNPTKNFFIKVVDSRLLNKTGGIVKGMSGSPIIQDGKIVGAITHTIVDNPEKGFGISIIKMLESVE